jgi:hypothetical protein
MATPNGVTNYTKQYINGEWVTSTHGADSLIDVHDSNTGLVFARAPKGSTADSEKAIEVCPPPHMPPMHAHLSLRRFSCCGRVVGGCM